MKNFLVLSITFISYSRNEEMCLVCTVGKPEIIGIALAYGDIYDNKGSGSLILPPNGAIARFNTVAKFNPSRIISTAGYGRKSHLLPTEKRKISLAHQLKRWVNENNPRLTENLLASALCWSTRNEIRVGIKISRRISGEDSTVILIVASNIWHLPRIWMYMKLYTPKNWRFKLVIARHHFAPLDPVLEVAKMILGIVYIIKTLYRLKKFQKSSSTPQ